MFLISGSLTLEKIQRFYLNYDSMLSQPEDRNASGVINYWDKLVLCP